MLKIEKPKTDFFIYFTFGSNHENQSSQIQIEIEFAFYYLPPLL